MSLHMKILNVRYGEKQFVNLILRYAPLALQDCKIMPLKAHSRKLYKAKHARRVKNTPNYAANKKHLYVIWETLH